MYVLNAALVHFVARHFVAFTSSQSFRRRTFCRVLFVAYFFRSVRRTLIFFVLLLTIFSVSLLIMLFFIRRNVIERLIHFYLVNHALHKNEQFYKKKQEKKKNMKTNNLNRNIDKYL